MRNYLLRWPLLAVLALLPGCDDGTTDPNDPRVLSLSLSAASAPADGATLVHVTASVDPDTRGDRRSLTFTVSGATLTEGDGKSATVTADEDGIARLSIRAPQEPGMARVRLSVQNIVRQDSVEFTRALPQRLDVEPEKFALSAGVKNELRVAAQLRRATGRVSPSTPVTFRAFQAGTSTEVGQFGVASPSDANGVATVRYTAGSTSYRGPVRIVASAPGEGAAQVIGETMIEVID